MWVSIRYIKETRKVGGEGEQKFEEEDTSSTKKKKTDRNTAHAPVCLRLAVLQRCTRVFENEGLLICYRKTHSSLCLSLTTNESPSARVASPSRRRTGELTQRIFPRVASRRELRPPRARRGKEGSAPAGDCPGGPSERPIWHPNLAR